eukprot:515206_1
MGACCMQTEVELKEINNEEQKSLLHVCDSIDNCNSVSRIANTLESYSSSHINNNAHKSLIQLCTNQSKDLLDDYHHILSSHHMNNVYLFIINNYQLKKCNISNCLSSQRNIRTHVENTAQLDDKFIFWTDLLDTIHVSIFHDSDFTKRIKPNPFNPQTEHTPELTRHISNKFKIEIKQNESIEHNKIGKSFSIGFLFYYWEYYKNKTE